MPLINDTFMNAGNYNSQSEVQNPESKIRNSQSANRNNQAFSPYFFILLYSVTLSTFNAVAVREMFQLYLFRL